MEGIAELLAGRVQLVALAATGRALVDAVGRTAPDLVITDVNMPHGSGVDAMKSVRAAGARTPFLFLTIHAEGPLVASVMRAGASGYILKSAAGEELLQAVDVVLAGGTYVAPSLGGKVLSTFSVQRYRLTPRQDQILHLTGRGLRTKQIAATLAISTRTVEAHRYTLMEIFEVHSVLQLVRRATDLGCLAACAPDEIEAT
jgi:DNA-binding NarL/FixJ family response regulator